MADGVLLRLGGLRMRSSTSSSESVSVRSSFFLFLPRSLGLLSSSSVWKPLMRPPLTISSSSRQS